MKPNLSRRVIGCAIEVHKRLGCGFLETVYENALSIELKGAGMHFERQVPVTVRYRNQVVGKYVADLIIENELLLELKAQNDIGSAAEAQLLNYLKATGLPVGLILNFGKTRLQIRRLVHKLEAKSLI